MGSRYFSKRYNPESMRHRKPRPKTFKSSESAKKWAEANKLSKYEIKTKPYSTNEKKFFIVEN